MYIMILPRTRGKVKKAHQKRKLPRFFYIKYTNQAFYCKLFKDFFVQNARKEIAPVLGAISYIKSTNGLIILIIKIAPMIKGKTYAK